MNYYGAAIVPQGFALGMCGRAYLKAKAHGKVVCSPGTGGVIPQGGCIQNMPLHHPWPEHLSTQADAAGLQLNPFAPHIHLARLTTQAPAMNTHDFRHAVNTS